MKKLLLPIIAIAIIAAFYEQSKSSPNLYITVIAIAVFMLGMMQLSAKTPSKNQNNDQDGI